MRLGDEQWCEDDPGVPQQLAEHLLVEVVAVEDPHLAAQRADVLDDVPRARLTERELVLVRSCGFDHADESLHGERVVLGGHPEQPARPLPADVPLLEQGDLLDDLPGVPEELDAVDGEHDPLADRTKRGRPIRVSRSFIAADIVGCDT
ncbi:hypothetical protein QP157_07670 [Sphingomonas sp. LR61]